jgi:hypothetical protein
MLVGQMCILIPLKWALSGSAQVCLEIAKAGRQYPSFYLPARILRNMQSDELYMNTRRLLTTVPVPAMIVYVLRGILSSLTFGVISANLSCHLQAHYLPDEDLQLVDNEKPRRSKPDESVQTIQTSKHDCPPDPLPNQSWTVIAFDPN